VEARRRSADPAASVRAGSSELDRTVDEDCLGEGHRIVPPDRGGDDSAALARPEGLGEALGILVDRYHPHTRVEQPALAR